METNTQNKSADKLKEQNNDLVIHYLTHRKGLGWMGLLLPFALIAGSFIWNKGHIETSISNYFHTCLRDVFVVTLCAVALFLFTYRGYNARDRWVTNIAGLFGLITAFVPTTFKCDISLPAYKLAAFQNGSICPINILPDEIPGQSFRIIPAPQAEYIGYIHLGCAAIFFLALAYMSYFQFTISSNPKALIDKHSQKAKRNLVYKICGVVILVCVLALTPCFADPSIKEMYDNHKLIFWGESISLWAFGISWLIKGEALLKDK